MVEMIAQVLIPIAMIFALGFYVNRRRFSWVVYGAMTLGIVMLLVPPLLTELHGNPAIARLDVSQLLLLPHHRRVYIGPDGGPHTRTIRSENWRPGD